MAKRLVKYSVFKHFNDVIISSILNLINFVDYKIFRFASKLNFKTIVEIIHVHWKGKFYKSFIKFIHSLF